MANKNKIDQHTLESMDINIIMMEDKNMLNNDIMANKNKIDQHTLESMDINIIMMEDKNMLNNDIMAQVTKEDLIDFYTKHNECGFMSVDIDKL